LQFSERQIEQFSRQILLKEIGVNGQKKLMTSSIFMVGAGGLGSAALMYLAAAGIGHIGVIDSDQVDLSNLHRQILYRQNDVGKSKIVSAKKTIHQINPDCRVDVFSERLGVENIRAIIHGYDLVLDGSDNFATRFLVADFCWFEKIPLISAAAIGFEGQLLSVLPLQNSPCYRCFIPEPPDITPTCREAGVLGPVVGVMGSLQAIEAIKVLLCIGENLAHHLLIYKALKGEFRTVRRPADPACPLCSDKPMITHLVEYGAVCHG
jgi:adenylyltransferase/sulfurtransferase